jgi:outer membrane protein, multidrug efflux system
VATLNAFWEVDLWGRVRRLNESARAQFLASEEARRGVRLSLLSDVATDYLRLLELDQELEIARRTTNSFGESLKNFHAAHGRRHGFGLGSSARRSRPGRRGRRHTVHPGQISTTENELCILLGRPRADSCAPVLHSWLPPKFRRACPPPCWSAGPMCAKRSNCCAPPTRKSANRWRSSFPKIGLTAFSRKNQPGIVRLYVGRRQRLGRGRRGRRSAF